MNKKFLIIPIILIGIIAGSWWLWQHRYQYFFKGDLGQNATEPPADSPTMNQLPESEDEMIESTEEPEDSDTETGSITEYDCDKQCENRRNTSSFEYCRELCGLREKEDGITEQAKTGECSSLSGLDRDTCYKRQAIDKKDDRICREIKDEQLKQNCMNRVAEEIID